MPGSALNNRLVCTHENPTMPKYVETSSEEDAKYTLYHAQQQHRGPMHNCSICESGRRGGVAARGAGSHSLSTSTRESKATPHLSLLISKDDDDGDSDLEPYPVSPPLSPKTTTVVPRPRSRYRAATMHQDASVKRRSGWKPSLKEELLRRTSTDSAMGQIELRTNQPTEVWAETKLHLTPEESTKTQQPQRRRGSTLLHPSPPVMPTEDYAAPIHIQPISPLFGKKDFGLTRKGSSLLHPSSPLSDSETELERGMRSMQLKTVLSIPPRKHWR